MSIFCPFCGEELPDGAKFCKNCGGNVESYSKEKTPQYTQLPATQKSHTLATVLGFLFSILIPLIGIIIGIYLYTRKDSDDAKRYGLIIIILGAVVWVISFFTTLMF